MEQKLRNRRHILVSRPDGAPGPENFRLVEEIVPDLRDRELLLKTQWLSIEPYMALAMKGSIDTIPNPTRRHRLLELMDRYICGVELGTVMGGPTISKVIKSRHPDFIEGDIVLAYSGWQEYAIDDGITLRKLDPAGPSPRLNLGLLGLPGMTAYVGMKDIGKPQKGETVVVSAALGAVGSLAGQIAKIAGARVVGIVSGPEKCRDLIEIVGFDAAVDRLDKDFPAQLAKACPNGIDVYFENAGGPVWWAVFDLLNSAARVVVSGLITQYTATGPDAGIDRTMDVLEKVGFHRLTIGGIGAIFGQFNREEDFLRDVTGWVTEGRIHCQEHIVNEFEGAPQALADVLKGRNRGKMVVRVSND